MPHGRPLLASKPRSLRRLCALTDPSLTEPGRPCPIAERDRERNPSALLPVMNPHELHQGASYIAAARYTQARSKIEE